MTGRKSGLTGKEVVAKSNCGPVCYLVGVGRRRKAVLQRGFEFVQNFLTSLVRYPFL